MKNIIDEYGTVILTSLAIVLIVGIISLNIEQFGSMAKTILSGIIGR